MAYKNLTSKRFDLCSPLLSGNPQLLFAINPAKIQTNRTLGNKPFSSILKYPTITFFPMQTMISQSLTKLVS